MDPSSGIYSQPPYLQSHLPITNVNAPKYPFSNLPQDVIQPPSAFTKPMMQVNGGFAQQHYPLNNFYPWKVPTPQNLPKKAPTLNEHTLSSHQILTHLSNDITLKSIQNTLSLLLHARITKENCKQLQRNKSDDKVNDTFLNEANKSSLKTMNETFQISVANETGDAPASSQKFHYELRKQEFNDIFFFCRNNHVFPSSTSNAKSPEMRGTYCDQLTSLLSSTVPLPFSFKWPGVSQNEHCQWLLGSALCRRLKKSRLARHTGYLPPDQPNDYFFSKIEEEKKAWEEFNTLSTTLNEQSSLTITTFDWIATCYTHLDLMKKYLNSASYSAIHSSAKFDKDDPCLIPSFLYLPQDASDLQQHHSNTQPFNRESNKIIHQSGSEQPDDISCDSLTTDTTKKTCTSSNKNHFINPLNYCSDGFEDFFPLSKASTVQETPWDIEEMALGALWDESVLESFLKGTSDSTHNSPSMFWGEYQTVNGYLATQRFFFLSTSEHLLICFYGMIYDCRYHQLKNPSTWQRGDKAEMTESFELLDRAASNEIHLQRCLLRSLSAYKIENRIEKALAFAGFIMDINDKEMFFCKTFTRSPEMLLQTPTCYKNKQYLVNSDTDDTSNGSSDQETVSVSSGLLSNIVDEDYGFTLNGVSGINLGTTGREFFSTDRKIPDKKLQLKKRSQEKERRIRLALLGLAPHVARNIDDTPNKSKHIDKALNGTNSPTASQQAKPSNAIKDYRELRQRYRSLFSINRLQMTLNYNLAAHDRKRFFG
ncbi:uncharacterized protein LOC128883117 [Hylaeus volcanicus]|uniref:uncharacterized protein LOC128883117 n=1 Tax=Hylaeus volcanicus TaxID=313075 RepID=UPI0023B7C987|nr:uncharacterized protein LOC128883117 [Hylaeus volcanicus]